MATYKNFGIVDKRGDIRKIMKACAIAPNLLTKSLPPTLRAAMVPFTRRIKQQARNWWPEEIFFSTRGKRRPKPNKMWGVKTRVPKKKWHPRERFKMQFRPSSQGAAVLMEFGSYKGRRYPKNGRRLAFKIDGVWAYPTSTEPTKPKPVWRRAYANFKASGGPRNIQELLIKNVQATMYNAMVKGGFSPTITTR